MSAEMTTLVWERVCVVCGSPRTVRREEAIYCAGCMRQVAQMAPKNRTLSPSMAAQLAWRDVAEKLA